MIKNRLEQISDVKNIRLGDLLLTVDHEGYESLDIVDCIDNGCIFTLDHTGWSSEEPLDTYIEDYRVIYRIK